MNFTSIGFTDYQYNELSSMDYNTLVSLLSRSITPYTRKNVLHILMTMNDKLMQNSNEHMNSYSDSHTVFGDRIGTFNTRRKKDLSEQKHPSQIANAELTPRSYLSASVSNTFRQTPNHHMSRGSRVDPLIVGNSPINLSGSSENFDDVLNELTGRSSHHEESDDLDEKLARIQSLHTKISKRKRAKSPR